MGLFSGNQGRTERATSKRRSESRSKGQVARSTRLVSATALLGLFFVLGIQLPVIVHSLSSMLHRTLSGFGPADLTIEKVQEMLVKCAMDVASAVFLICGTAIVLGVGANMAQGGLVFSTGKLGLHIENLNPAAGFKKLMPGAATGELLKSIFTVVVIGYTGYGVYSGALAGMPRMVLMRPLDSASLIGQIVYKFAMKSGLLLLIIGGADYYFSRRKFENSIKMTKQEIKDESRNAEGNPEIKSKIRRKQREMALRNMMKAVSKADVVITNPTHYAVALQYSPGMTAPTVVAKGKGFVALRIREIAQENNVPLVENKPLAQGLYKAVEIGQQIPADLFKAVAEVLAYIYRLKSMRL
jgi:flagellar biosynthetic protein FlhB